MKYIDADKIRAEIERQIEEDKNNITEDTKPYYGARQQVRSKFLALLDSLQQEQTDVDLEKEIERYLLDNVGLFVHANSETVVQALASHFYELGLKARKE